MQLDSISGLLSATAGTTGVAVAGSGSPTLTLTGTLAQVNALLAGGGGGTVTYLVGSDSPFPTDTLTLVDQRQRRDRRWRRALGVGVGHREPHGGERRAADHDPGHRDDPRGHARSCSAPAAATRSRSPTSTPAARRSQVTLNVSNGLVTLAGTAGLAFTAGDGTADASMTFTGTVAAINAALNGLAFAPTANFNGSAFLSLSVDDQGNSGSGGALSDADFTHDHRHRRQRRASGADSTVATPQDTPHVSSPANFGFTDGRRRHAERRSGSTRCRARARR